MVTYFEAGKMLDKAVDALPQAIFDGLNGGVNLIEEPKSDGKGGYILGYYHHNIMGRYIEIFYGSFKELYGDIPREQFERRLISTLHHELTHHIEGLAGDRSLERWDEDQDLLWEELENEEPVVSSILFLDDDDCALAPAAKAIFDFYAKERCPDIPSESAGIFASGDGLHPDCTAAAKALGADFSGHRCKELTEELMDSYSLVMCMTLAQADEIMERYPGNEGKILCVYDLDILRPRFKGGWKKAVERIDAALDDYSGQLYDKREEAEETAEESGEAEDSRHSIEIVMLDASAPNSVTARIGELEASEFSAPWTEDMLRRALNDENKIFFAAMEGEKPVGYIGAQLLFEEMEVYNVMVDAPFRGQGIGRRLVQRLVDHARDTGGVERISLEVRASNAPALGLYEKLGFEEVGRRKNYYRSPKEDAVLMDLVLV